LRKRQEESLLGSESVNVLALRRILGQGPLQSLEGDTGAA
jgi:hypothetical protein